jgi:hypothetical protein
MHLKSLQENKVIEQTMKDDDLQKISFFHKYDKIEEVPDSESSK